jgi:serine/threonine protein kinase
MPVDQRLRVIGGPDKGLSFQLPQAGSETLGKSRQHNEICLHDPAVARVHCQVEMEDGRVVLSDFDSDAGTFVNGSRITQQELKHGDVVKIGDTELQFQSIGGPAPAAARPPKTPEPSAAPARPASPAPLTPPAAFQTTPPGDLSALSGTTLAHYELGPFLGRGYFGAVYRAHDRKEDRTVALKVLSAEFPKGEQESQQFVQAIKAAVQVRHPNLITIFGAGRTAANYWIAMEYVEGESLAGVLQLTNTPGTSDWRQAFRLAVHLARALYFIHENQLLHRNITPQNILLRNIDRQTKLGDLFLSKAIAGSSLRQNVLRAKLANELPYMSPEQTVPNAATDARSDIYAVGAVVYHLLAGRALFSGNSPAEMISMIREAPPPAPKQANPSIPDAFELIVLRMLAKSPRERHQTAGDLLSELSRINPEPLG